MKYAKATSADIVATRKSSVLWVTLNRVQVRNALSLGVLEKLREIFGDSAGDKELRLAVVTGAGNKAFASGGDLVELAAMRSTADAEAFSKHGRHALDSIRTFPVPVVAALNGLALGGGAELAVACDLRFAAAHATIGFIHSRLNICPAWGGGHDLMRLTTYARGLRLLTSAAVRQIAPEPGAPVPDAGCTAQTARQSRRRPEWSMTAPHRTR